MKIQNDNSAKLQQVGADSNVTKNKEKNRKNKNETLFDGMLPEDDNFGITESSQNEKSSTPVIPADEIGSKSWAAKLFLNKNDNIKYYDVKYDSKGRVTDLRWIGTERYGIKTVNADIHISYGSDGTVKVTETGGLNLGYVEVKGERVRVGKIITKYDEKGNVVSARKYDANDNVIEKYPLPTVSTTSSTSTTPATPTVSTATSTSTTPTTPLYTFSDYMTGNADARKYFKNLIQQGVYSLNSNLSAGEFGSREFMTKFLNLPTYKVQCLFDSQGRVVSIRELRMTSTRLHSDPVDHGFGSIDYQISYNDDGTFSVTKKGNPILDRKNSKFYTALESYETVTNYAANGTEINSTKTIEKTNGLKIVTQYDGKGKEVSVKEYNNGEEIPHIPEGERGSLEYATKLIRQGIYSAFSIYGMRNSYTKNADGQVVSLDDHLGYNHYEIKYNSNGETEITRRNEAANRDIIITSASYNKDGIIKEMVNTQYYGATNTPRGKVVISYDENGLKTGEERTYYNEDGTIKYIHTYDAEGNTISFREY